MANGAQQQRNLVEQQMQSRDEDSANGSDSADSEGTQAGPLVISCDECVMQHTDACDDCLVSFILDRRPGEAVVIDVEEARAVRMLTSVGLVPAPRHVRRAG
jgi:hypothetical protein